MLCPSGLGLVILLMLGGTHGDSVNQTEGPVTVPEAEFLTLNCTYQTTYTSSYYLFWYVQYQNKEPVFLLKSSSDDQEVNSQGFQATLVKKHRSFHLKKPSVQMSDSAVYFCALRDTVRESPGGAEHKPRGAHTGLQASSLALPGATVRLRGCSHDTCRTQKVIEVQCVISVVQKEAVTLYYVYEASSYTFYLSWYKQPSSQKVTFHQEPCNAQNTAEGRYSLNFQKPVSYIHLNITASHLGDSAVYFCAVQQATVMGVPVGAPQNCSHMIGPLGRESVTDRKRVRHRQDEAGAVSAQVGSG